MAFVGGKEVIVNKGELVKIYADPSVIGKDVFELAISGDSVINLRNLNDSNIEEVSKDCFVYRGSLVVHFKEGTVEKQAHNVLWKLKPYPAFSSLNPLNLSYSVYLVRNSSYSDIKKYADAYQKEASVEYVRLQNHNVSCYPDYSENFDKILTEEPEISSISLVSLPEEPEIKEEKEIDKTTKEPALSAFQKIWRWILSLVKQ